MHVLLKQLRERAGLTVREAAERLGVQRATVYSWEAAETNKTPEPAKLRAVMDLYGATNAERSEIARLRAFGPEPDDEAGAAAGA